MEIVGEEGVDELLIKLMLCDAGDNSAQLAILNRPQTHRDPCWNGVEGAESSRSVGVGVAAAVQRSFPRSSAEQVSEKRSLPLTGPNRDRVSTIFGPIVPSIRCGGPAWLGTSYGNDRHTVSSCTDDVNHMIIDLSEQP
ncbi:hypothetical protein PMIN02_005929 [Paraphaeosphaeria minitans]